MTATPFSPQRVLVTDDTHPVLIQRLEAAGYPCDLRTDLDYDTLLQCIDHYDALVVRSKIPIDSAFLHQCHRLRCIGRVGAGMETIDVDCAEQLGIRCLNSPEGNRDAVGEHAVMLLLSLFNHLATADAEVRQGQWRREANRGLELQGKTVGILGMGNMGGSFAQRLRGFGCRVVAYDLQGRQASGFLRESWVESLPLAQLQQQADILSLHLPLTPLTRHLVDTPFLHAFAKPLYLLNTSRGAVVDTDALAQAIRTGRVLGAALDVVEYEDMSRDGLSVDTLPASFRYLLQSSRTLFTPHVAGWTVESKYKLAAVLADKIIHHLQSAATQASPATPQSPTTQSPDA